MYRAALTLNADEFEAVSRFAFLEMAMAGITTVGEFHYVHHQPDGTGYDDPNELAHRVIRAAKDVGIRICLLNVAYQFSDFNRQPAKSEQRRFVNSVDQFIENVNNLMAEYKDNELVTIGVAPHSLRAVDPEGLQAIYDSFPDLPIHIHVSEQPQEVLNSIVVTGQRPVEWLADQGFLNENVTLVHATHVKDYEIESIAKSGANVCVCPTTERNLGDGMFQTRAFLEHDIPLCLGTDSHIQIDMFEEARELEYLERLKRIERNLISNRPALTLMPTLHSNGEKALHIEPDGDFITIDLDSPRLVGCDLGNMAEAMIFSASPSDVRDVFVGHRCVIGDRKHPRAEKITHEFKQVMEKLWP